MMKYIIDNLLKSRGQIRIKSEISENVNALIKKLHPVKLNQNLIRIGPNGDGWGLFGAR